MEIIKLKNGQKIELQWSFLILQYLEDYEGGFKRLKSDIKMKKNQLKIMSLFIYTAVRANYDEKLSYQEAIRLVPTTEIQKIVNFFEKNIKEQAEFKKKHNINHHKKKLKK